MPLSTGRQVTMTTLLDCLSCPSTALPVDAEGEAVETFHMSQFDPLPLTAEQVRRETRRDPTLAAVYQAVQTDDFSDCADHQPYYHQRSELTSHQGCLLWGVRVTIQPGLQRDVLDKLHSSHCGIVRTKELARCYVWWPKIDHDIESCVSSCSNCQQHRHPTLQSTRGRSRQSRNMNKSQFWNPLLKSVSLNANTH